MVALSKKKSVLAATAAVAVGLGAVAYSPYHRHNRQAAEFAEELGGLLSADGQMKVIDHDHRVDNLGPTGGYCYFVADLTLSTRLDFSAAKRKIEAVFRQDLDGYRLPSITSEGSRDGRNIVRLVVSRVGEGGSMDLRCG